MVKIWTTGLVVVLSASCARDSGSDRSLRIAPESRGFSSRAVHAEGLHAGRRDLDIDVYASSIEVTSEGEILRLNLDVLRREGPANPIVVRYQIRTRGGDLVDDVELEELTVVPLGETRTSQVNFSGGAGDYQMEVEASVFEPGSVIEVARSSDFLWFSKRDGEFVGLTLTEFEDLPFER